LPGLPEEQREVILLVGLEGLRYAEAAVILSVPIGTVRSRLSRARDTLRKLLDRDAAGVVPVVLAERICGISRGRISNLIRKP
jgi:predicted DNA-binding protein (UPF0251 family)